MLVTDGLTDSLEVEKKIANTKVAVEHAAYSDVYRCCMQFTEVFDNDQGLQDLR